MGLRITSNIEAFNSHRNLALNSSRLSKSMEKLSSGFRINSAADDAAGLGISERLRSQISGLSQAQRNVQDGISMVQTAEGSMEEITSILQRVRELAVQYNNGVNGAAAKSAITGEVTQLSAEVTRLMSTAQYNGISLLNGGTASFQVGANQGETLSVTLVNAGTSLGSILNTFATDTTGTVNISAIDTAISNIAGNRATYGAVQNRLDYANSSLGVYQENMMAAESRIRDVDMAEEMTRFTKLQILQQSGTAMLAQANMAPQSILSLLK